MAKKRVLLIDDEASFTELLKVNLEEAGGYDVRIENRGSYGLEAARDFQPDIIFLDVIMPDLDGSRVAALLKMDAVLKDVPIVYVTAILSKRDKNAPSTIGGVGFIAKPVSTGEIIACIQKYAGNGVSGSRHSAAEKL